MPRITRPMLCLLALALAVPFAAHAAGVHVAASAHPAKRAAQPHMTARAKVSQCMSAALSCRAMRASRQM